MKTTTDRLLVAYNPNSTRAGLADEGVRKSIASLDLPKGQVQEYSFKYSNVADNIDDLAGAIEEGDNIVVVGGDGTLHTAGNSLAQSGKQGVRMSVVGYGNFNDGASTFNNKIDVRNPLPLLEQSAKSTTLHPLEVLVNGELWRDGMLYVTLGQSAILASLFNDPDVRHELHSGKSSARENFTRLGKEYFSRRTDNYLAPFLRDDDTLHSHTTDILNMNSPRVARFARSNDHHYHNDTFAQHDLDITHITPNLPFIVKSLAGHMPGHKLREDTVRFISPSDVPIQADGENSLLKNVETLTIRKKRGDGITIMTNRSHDDDVVSRQSFSDSRINFKS